MSTFKILKNEVKNDITFKDFSYKAFFLQNCALDPCLGKMEQEEDNIDENKLRIVLSVIWKSAMDNKSGLRGSKKITQSKTSQ